jgi:oligopeptide transport system ATP-binding protein
MSALLEVEDLRVWLPGGERPLPAVDGVDLSVGEGQVLGIAGESGSGKTMTALALLGLLPHGATVRGRARFAGGRDLLAMRQQALQELRGREIAMVFQDPMTSLHPMLSIERQLTEHVRHHLGLDRAAARARAAALLEQVRIPDPQAALRAYPHQFSGGMRQRIAIAIAVACGPRLLIADEPTTALDVTVQAGILRLLDRLRREQGLSVIVITHDLGVLSAIADDLAVFYAGRVVEAGPRRLLLGAPRHPYTAGLLGALPHPEGSGEPRGGAPVGPEGSGEPRGGAPVGRAPVGSQGGQRRAALTPIPGAPPALGAVPGGCPFHPRCPYAKAACASEVPALAAQADGRRLACPVDPLAAGHPAPLAGGSGR